MARGGGFLFRVVILPGSTLWALGVDWVTGLFSLWHNSAIHTLELHLSCYNPSISGSLSLGEFKLISQKLPYLILSNSYAWLQVRRNSRMKYSLCSLLRWIFASWMIQTQGFLFTQISGHSPIKMLEVLNNSELQDNFLIYIFHMSLIHMKSKCPATKFG